MNILKKKKLKKKTDPTLQPKQHQTKLTLKLEIIKKTLVVDQENMQTPPQSTFTFLPGIFLFLFFFFKF